MLKTILNPSVYTATLTSCHTHPLHSPQPAQTQHPNSSLSSPAEPLRARLRGSDTSRRSVRHSPAGHRLQYRLGEFEVRALGLQVEYFSDQTMNCRRLVSAIQWMCQPKKAHRGSSRGRALARRAGARCCAPDRPRSRRRGPAWSRASAGSSVSWRRSQKKEFNQPQNQK